MMYGLRRRWCRSECRPAQSLSRFETMSATPSMSPSATGPAASTVTSSSGMSGTTISLAKSLSRLTNPMTTTVRGRRLGGVADMARFGLAPGGALYCCENAVRRLYVHPKS